MGCENWNDQWVAALYGELEGAEARQADEHLRRCDACRVTLERLTASRDLLLRVSPSIPAMPRTTFPEPRRRTWPSAWAFAAGMACAALAFAVGLFAAQSGRSVAFPAEQQPEQARSEVEDPFRLEQVEQRLLQLEQRAALPAASAVEPVTRELLEQRLARLERRLRDDRAYDLGFLLGEIQATEARAGSWIGETREALRLVALQNDPRVSRQ